MTSLKMYSGIDFNAHHFKYDFSYVNKGGVSHLAIP